MPKDMSRDVADFGASKVYSSTVNHVYLTQPTQVLRPDTKNSLACTIQAAPPKVSLPSVARAHSDGSIFHKASSLAKPFVKEIGKSETDVMEDKNGTDE